MAKKDLTYRITRHDDFWNFELLVDNFTITIRINYSFDYEFGDIIRSLGLKPPVSHKELKSIFDRHTHWNPIISKVELNENSELLQNDHFQRPTTEVYIYIPQIDVPLFLAEEITNASGEFMEALGFELEMEDEPIYKSFWKRLKYVFSKHINPEELDDLFEKGKQALELRHIDVPTADQTEKLSLSAQRLVSALDKFEEGAVRCGALLVLKMRINGRPKIFIQQLTRDLVKIFEDKPQLLYNLQTVYELVTGDVNRNAYDDAGTGTALIEE